MIGPFRLYQVLLMIFAVLTIAFVYHRLRSKKTTPATFAVWILHHDTFFAHLAEVKLLLF